MKEVSPIQPTKGSELEAQGKGEAGEGAVAVETEAVWTLHSIEHKCVASGGMLGTRISSMSTCGTVLKKMTRLSGRRVDLGLRDSTITAPALALALAVILFPSFFPSICS